MLNRIVKSVVQAMTDTLTSYHLLIIYIDITILS